MFYIVYKTTNIINGKIYIGSHISEYVNDKYLGSGKLLFKAIKRYGRKNFEKNNLAIFNNVKEMFNLEVSLVDEDFIKRSDTYNIKKGGYGGWAYINKRKTKKELQEACKKGLETRRFLLKNDEEYKKRVSINISRAKKGMIGTFTGKKHKESTKKKIGEANKIKSSGIGNSQWSTCWIYSLTEEKNIKVKKTELEMWIQLGWKRGRALGF